jgi:hypothetical protein
MNKQSIIGISLAVIGFIIICAIFLHMSKNKKQIVIVHKADHYDRVMGHSGSSIDSERQFSRSEQWKGQSSKCYDCERDMQSRCGDAAVFNATKQKLFSV